MGEESILLTVIIPVYNVEMYISRCIESVIKQTYKNIEIILIDDGSTDATGEICDKFTQIDDRIKVYHKKNNGLVLARKDGCDFARGELITFVDGDDWIEPDMYSKMIEEYKIGHADMITSGIICERDEQQNFCMDNLKAGNYNKDEILQYIIPRMMYMIENDSRGIVPSVCIKLFKASILKKIIRLVDPFITFGEDGAIVYLFIACSDKITILKQAWYHYVYRENSMMRHYGFDSFERVYCLEQFLLDEFKKINDRLELDLQVKYYIRDFLCVIIKNIYKINLESDVYIYPYGDELNGCKVILYGAGRVGQSYWKYLRNDKRITLISWIDRNYKKLQTKGLDVKGLNALVELEYDYLIIAIENENVVSEVIEQLLYFGVPKEKILWREGKKISGSSI